MSPSLLIKSPNIFPPIYTKLWIFVCVWFWHFKICEIRPPKICNRQTCQKKKYFSRNFTNIYNKHTLNKQGSIGIRQCPMNWCTPLMFLHKIIPSINSGWNVWTLDLICQPNKIHPNDAAQNCPFCRLKLVVKMILKINFMNQSIKIH